MNDWIKTHAPELANSRRIQSNLWYRFWYRRGNLGLRIWRGACKVLQHKDAPVAQLDRAFDYESKGRTFESCRAHHKYFFVKYLH